MIMTTALLTLLIFITGFYLGKNRKKTVVEDLRHDMSDIYLRNQALILRVQELEAMLDGCKESLPNR